MLEDVHIAARWSLYALGTVEGQHVKRPRDPVAAWLLRRHPRLLPAYAAPSRLARIRACATVVDRMIGDEVLLARAQREPLAYHGLGCGFDARWHRLAPAMRDVVSEHVEIDEPALMHTKDRLLSDSTFAEAWSGIRRVELGPQDWDLPGERSGRPLIVAEDAAERLGADELEALLVRIRRSSPDARMILALPGDLAASPTSARPASEPPSRARWTALGRTASLGLSQARAAELGWRTVEDLRFAGRPELRASSGLVMCPAVEAFRVVRLHPLGAES